MPGYDYPAERRRMRLSRILATPLLVFLLLSSRLPGQTAAPLADQAKTGTLSNLHSDKRVVQNGRWFLVREFTVEFAIRDSVTYCGEVTTTDATEAHDRERRAGGLGRGEGQGSLHHAQERPPNQGTPAQRRQVPDRA